jgi:hypothetical protein
MNHNMSCLYIIYKYIHLKHELQVLIISSRYSDDNCELNDESIYR